MIKRTNSRDPLEVLAEEFVERTRDGESVSIEDFALQNEEIADEVRKLFPMLLEMEQLRSRRLDHGESPEIFPELPIHFGDYEIIREIGRGAMGVVYEAEQRALGRRVALKVFPLHALTKTHQLERFQKESRTAARLHHTNIVPVFGVGQHDGVHYFVMQRIEGITLDKLIQLEQQGVQCSDSQPSTRSPSSSTERDSTVHPTHARESFATTTRAKTEGRIPNRCGANWWTTVAEIGVQVSQALAYAHEQGVIHGDIKPSNLILDANDTVWVTDFGLAQAWQQPKRDTDVVSGTLRFMAPEHLAGDQTLASDLYSLGMTLYELATLRPAFLETHRATLVQQIAEGAFERPRAIVPEMPADLEAIIMKASSRDVGSRYENAQAISDDLSRFLDGKAVLARKIGIVASARRSMKRNPVITSLSVLLVLVIIGSFALVGTRWRVAVAENQRAENNLSLAIQSIDRILDRFTSTSIAHPTATESIGGEAVSSNLQVRYDVSDQSVEALRDALFFYNKFAERNPTNPELRREITRVHRRAGDIYVRLGQYPKAVASYQQSLDSLEWTSVDRDTNIALDTATTLNRLGTTLQFASRFSESETAFQRAQQILSLPVHGQDARCMAELARTFNHLGLTHRRMGHFRESKACQRQGVDILEKLVQQYPDDVDFRLALAIAYRGFYPFASRGSDRHERERVRTGGIEILEKLVEEFPDVPGYQYELCETLITSLSSRDSRGERLRQITRGLALASTLTQKHPGVPRSRVLKADALRELAPAQPAEIADQSYVESIDIYESLTRDFPQVPSYRILLATALHDHARCLVDIGRPCDALERLLQSIAEQQTYLQLRPDSRFGRRHLERIRATFNKTLNRA